MIIFHEGLPGSGKSYEACVKHILEAVKNGRQVLTNINGINHQKFADISGVPLPVVKLLIDVISHADCDDETERLSRMKADFLSKTKKDSLIVIDEIQDMFPTERKPPSPEWSKYIASHRHEGLDIVLMGQDRRDVHPIWRRRIQRVITFNKLSAVGAVNRYRWECFEATAGEKFKSVSSGIQKYESKYFGLYSSHTQGTDNKSVYVDDRANILKNPKLRFAAIAFVFAAYFGITHAIAFFQPPEVSPSPAATGQINQQSIKAESTGLNENELKVRSPAPVEPEVTPPPIDIFDADAQRGRLHLAAYINFDGREFLRIEVRDESTQRVYAIYDRLALVDLGWKVEKTGYGIKLSKDRKVYVARPQPTENAYGQVTQRRVQNLDGS